MERKHGTTRVVYLIGRYAIKLPSMVEWRLFLLGLLANMQERRFWTMEHERLAPVYFACWGGFFLVMARCRPLTREEFSEFLACKPMMDLPLSVEDKLDSWGWHNDRIVAVDYGN